MTVDNNVLHNLILETLMAINIYMVGSILFQFTRRGKKVFLVLSLCKCSLWNVVDMALLTQKIVPDGRIQVVLNLPILISFLIVIKKFSGLDWLKVFLGSVIQELLSFPPLFLYLCVYRIYTGEWHGLNDMYAPLGWYVVIGSALTLVAIYIYKYFVEIIFGNYAKWELKQKGMYWGFIIVMVLITYGSVWTKDHSFEVSRYIIVVSVISALFLYETLWFWRWRKNQKTEQENKNLRYENSVMKEYYDTLENQVEVVRKFHHDINKHMDVLNEMLGKMETPEVKLYSEQLEEVYQEMKPVIYCSNPIVNAVLVNKAHQCEEKHIKFTIDMMGFETKKMKEIDLVALLSNLLDNAIEECERIQDKLDKKIYIHGWRIRNNLFLEVKNTTEKEVIDSSTFKTKKDPKSHGVGMKIIKEIIENYEGITDIEIENGEIEILIQIPDK